MLVPAATTTATTTATKWFVLEPRVEHVAGDFTLAVGAGALVLPTINTAVTPHDAILVFELITLVDVEGRLPLWESFAIHLDGFLQGMRKGSAWTRSAD